MSGTGGHRTCRSEFRDQSEVDEWHLESRALAGVDEVKMRQHRRSASDGCAVNRGYQGFVEVDQRSDQRGLRTLARPRRISHKVLQIVACAECIPGAVQEQ